MVQEGRKKFRGSRDPEYLFWMKLLENEPDVAQEFVRRVQCSSSGFINWDFLPRLSHVANRHESRQYREALKFAERRIKDRVQVNSSAPNDYNEHYHIAELRKITANVIAKRERDIKMNDTFFRMIWDFLRGDTTTERHKEVHELWMSVMNAFSFKANSLTSFVMDGLKCIFILLFSYMMLRWIASLIASV